MSSLCDRNIVKALALARRLNALADEGEQGSEDNGCALLYGIMRDCAYRIKTEAQRERALHRTRAVRLVEER